MIHLVKNTENKKVFVRFGSDGVCETVIETNDLSLVIDKKSFEEIKDKKLKVNIVAGRFRKDKFGKIVSLNEKELKKKQDEMFFKKK